MKTCELFNQCGSCETCQTTCQLDCQTACQLGCESTCQKSCQSACESCETCQDECQYSCQTSCEISNQCNLCESFCQNCETCQTACESCEGTCEGSCETACLYYCEGCESACESCESCQSGQNPTENAVLTITEITATSCLATVSGLDPNVSFYYTIQWYEGGDYFSSSTQIISGASKRITELTPGTQTYIRAEIWNGDDQIYLDYLQKSIKFAKTYNSYRREKQQKAFSTLYL